MVGFCDILPLFEVSTWLQFLFIVLAAIQMKFIDMALVQLSANASGVSAVAVYFSLPTAMKRESRELKSRSLIWPSTVPVFAIPPER